MAKQVLIAVKDKNGNTQTQAVSRKAYKQIYSREPEKYKLINGDAAAREIETAPKSYGRKVKTKPSGEPASEMKSAAEIAADLGIEKKSDELESFDLDDDGADADELNSEIENESKSKAKQSDDSKNAGAANRSTRKTGSRTRTGNKKKNS